MTTDMDHGPVRSIALQAFAQLDKTATWEASSHGIPGGILPQASFGRLKRSALSLLGSVPATP